jgi:hypothetical protein
MLVGFIVLMTSIVLSVSDAAAAVTPKSTGQAERAGVSPAGIGVGVVTVQTPQLVYQCDFTFCNSAYAYDQQDTADVCYLPYIAYAEGYRNLVLVQRVISRLTVGGG